MPRSLDIFVKSTVSLENFVKEVETLLKIQLQRIYKDGEVFYEFRDSHVVLTVGIHDLENDRDMCFEDYRYHISVRALNISTEEKRNKWRDEFAQFVFQELKATQKYHLMLVEDLQRKVAEFCPESNSVR